MKNPCCSVGVVLLFALIPTLLSCGGGGSGGGGEGSPSAASKAITVSGRVTAPGGQLAFHVAPSLLNKFASLVVGEASATVTGLSPVADGTPVQLGAFGQASPFVFTPIASTSTSGGRYSFDLTALGLRFSNDLAVRVGSGATQMRAFVIGPMVDISPVSEAGVRTVLQALGGQSLHQLTVQELADINGAATILASLSAGVTGNIQQSIDAVETMIAGSGPLTDFITSAVGPGQTAQAAGDIGNFLPLNQGNTWEYRKTRFIPGSAQKTYTNTHSISGTKGINSVTTLILRENNPENNGITEEEYIFRAATGITVHGSQPADVIAPQIVPYQAIRFPLSVFSKFVAVDMRRITISGVAVDLTVEVNVEGFESVSVPAGTYPNALKVVTNQVATLAGGSSPVAMGTETVWLVSNIGPVKYMVVISDGGTAGDTDIEELVQATVDGIEHIAGAQVRRVALAANDLIYDRISNLMYASVPGNPGSITAINPGTGSVGPSVPVGNQPNKLALSNDGQELYVSLDGEAAIRRVHLPTFSPEETLPLGANPIPGCGLLRVNDMEVLKENSRMLIVSKKHSGCTPQFVEVAAYENGVQKPNVIPRNIPGSTSVLIDYIEPASSPATIVGTSASGPDNFFIISVDSNGLSLNHRAQILSLSENFESDMALAVTGMGTKFDPITGTILGQIQGLTGIVTSETIRVRPDLSSQRLFFLPSQVASGIPVMLLAYDSTTLQQLGASKVHNGISGCSGCTFSIQGFVRWASKGLAFTTSNGQITLLETSFLP